LLQKNTKLLFYFEPVQLLLVMLKFRIKILDSKTKKIQNYPRIPNYSKVAIHTVDTILRFTCCTESVNSTFGAAQGHKTTKYVSSTALLLIILHQFFANFIIFF